MKFEDLTGLRFGRLIVRERDPLQTTRSYWRCLCDCGDEASVRAARLKAGVTSSCGCLMREAAATLAYKHGHAVNDVETPEFKAWSALRQRCTNPNASGFEHYGGRGIRVSPDWDTFSAFLADMGERPSSEHSIERLDVNGDYGPNNCIWADRKTQARNQRNNRLLTHNGQTLPAVAWSERTGLPQNTIYKRLAAGWDEQRALTTPRRAPRNPTGKRKARGEQSLIKQSKNAWGHRNG